ncbi:MAG: hypothetical protein OD814_001002 [Candidatus Alkanophagales archaeon MCA70_species_1]|nr:hypothetical protein [Candidatus Alkanophaga volatiphilum]
MVQINSQEKTLVVDVSVGYQRVEDFIIDMSSNAQNPDAGGEQTLSALTSTPASSSTAATPLSPMRREKSVPEFPSIVIPVAITLLSILFLKKVLVDRK